MRCEGNRRGTEQEIGLGVVVEVTNLNDTARLGIAVEDDTMCRIEPTSRINGSNMCANLANTEGFEKPIEGDRNYVGFIPAYLFRP